MHMEVCGTSHTNSGSSHLTELYIQGFENPQPVHLSKNVKCWYKLIKSLRIGILCDIFKSRIIVSDCLCIIQSEH